MADQSKLTRQALFENRERLKNAQMALQAAGDNITESDRNILESRIEFLSNVDKQLSTTLGVGFEEQPTAAPPMPKPTGIAKSGAEAFAADFSKGDQGKRKFGAFLKGLFGGKSE